MLMQFEPDTYLERRLEAADKPVPENRYRTITQAVKSRLFLYAQVGFSSSDGREVAYVYHRNPESQTGLQMAAKGPVEVVRKLMKKYKKAHRLRGLDFKEKTRPRIPIDPVSEQEA